MSKRSKDEKSAPSWLTHQNALELLESAAHYCQAAGVTLRIENLSGAEHAAGGALVITVTGAQMELTDGVTHFTVRPAADAAHSKTQAEAA